MHWSSSYIGIPHSSHGTGRDDGVNCWTLACLIYAEQLHITLPTYTDGYISLDEHAEIASLFEDEAGFRWREVEVPAEFDLAVFRRGRFETHVGIVVRTSVMLHVVGEDQSKIERFNNGVWKHRLQRFYRHVERLGVAA